MSQKALTITRTTLVLLCPHCRKGEKNAQHLPPGAHFGPWYCDECGGSFTGVVEADGTFTLSLEVDRKIETVDVLELPPQSKSVYFVVKGMRFTAGRAQGDEAEHKRYFYEEHSCPTNWLHPQIVYYDGDSDPHGLVRFVTSVDADSIPPDQNYGPNEYDEALVRLIEESSQEGETP